MTSPTIATHEQLGLVALSIAVAIVAGYLALDLAQRSAGASGVMRRAWIVAGGVTIGLGIWSMHFIGMLALKMAMPVSYDLPLVALSMIAAIGGSVIALAVAAMHYLGMASMEMEADIHWNAPLVALSLLIAFGASLAALFLVQQLGHSRFRMGFARRAGAALLLGLGISGLHYTAMAGTTFRAEMNAMTGMAAHQSGLGADGLVVLLALGAALMLAVVIGGAAADQRRAAVAVDLALVAQLARGLGAGDDARARACAAVLELTGADFVCLVEAGEDREPEMAACAGLDQPPTADAFAGEREALRALSLHGEPTFEADLPEDSAPARLGAASALYEPLLIDRQTVGYFAIGYRARRRRVSERTLSLLGMLASEAALTIDREDLLAQLDFMARRDELTGLVNRRVLRETLDEELARAAERESALSLAILDLDSFKKVNDARGHQAGDRLLRAAAAAWAEALDVQGTVGRYGGDEFMVILPGLDPTAGAAATERLRRVVPDGATCSAGIATWDGTQTAAQLIAAADAFLYAAKAAGRDRTATTLADVPASRLQYS
ncbi:MAG TPA: diguanylate cyclase [Solirubrobacterales bacterium]|nr:diguanylate cyclase [Solirubrobacterales bacterium]